MKWLKVFAILGVVIIGGAFAVVFALGRMPNADRMQASVEINAPTNKVWTWIDDGQKMKQWVSWLADVKESGPRGVGSTLTMTMRDENNGGQVMRIESRCTEYVPQSRMSVSLIAPEFEGAQSYRLTDLGNGRTRLETEGRFHFSEWFANFMTPLIMPAARSKLEGDLGRLKTLAEAS
jgi:uncharacterized protein YndB with AHSA1/START domain